MKKIFAKSPFSVPEFMFLCSMQGWLRSIWRFLHFVVSTFRALISLLFLHFFGRDKKAGAIRIRRNWLNRIPGPMGLQMKMEGIPTHGTCLYVSNHISYVDPICVLFHVDAHVVAKAEVKNWPLIGYGASLVGTLWVKRDEKTSRHETAQAIRDALMSGESILVFPEGTTTAGPHTLPFKPRSFSSAFEANVPVQPVAIIYDSPKVPFIGDDTFIPHFFRMFRMPYITGRVAFGPLLYGENTATEAEEWINQQQKSYHG